MNILGKILGVLGLSTSMIGTFCVFGFGFKAISNPNTSIEAATLIFIVMISCVLLWGIWFISKKC